MTAREGFEQWFRNEAARVGGDMPNFEIDAETGFYVDWVAQLQLDAWLAAIDWKSHAGSTSPTLIGAGT